MNTYVILRRNGWRSAEDLRIAAGRSKATVEQMSDDVAWIRSYVVPEPSGAVGTAASTRPPALTRSGVTPPRPSCRSPKSSRLPTP
jgi:hypothetical protein